MFLEIKIEFSTASKILKMFIILSSSKNTLKGLVSMSLSAFYESMCKYIFWKTFFQVLTNLFKKIGFSAGNRSLNFFKQVLVKNTLKRHFVIALSALYEIMHKNSLLGPLCNGPRILFMVLQQILLSLQWQQREN